ncbi:hypothetical protein J4410_01830 [Candidatus Woesearchaeota archaeon]|nr:hypothetical protein [Candidatus Woesearchaeota archaeon]
MQRRRTFVKAVGIVVGSGLAGLVAAGCETTAKTAEQIARISAVAQQRKQSSSLEALFAAAPGLRETFPDFSVRDTAYGLHMVLGTDNQWGAFENVVYSELVTAKIRVETKHATLYLDPRRGIEKGISSVRYVNTEGEIRDLIFVSPMQRSLIESTGKSVDEYLGEKYIHQGFAELLGLPTTARYIGNIEGHLVFDTFISFHVHRSKDRNPAKEFIERDPVQRHYPGEQEGEKEKTAYEQTVWISNTPFSFLSHEELSEKAAQEIADYVSGLRAENIDQEKYNQLIRMKPDSPELYAKLRKEKEGKNIAERIVLVERFLKGKEIYDEPIPGKGMHTPSEEILGATQVDCDMLAEIYKIYFGAEEGECGFPISPRIVSIPKNDGTRMFHVPTELYIPPTENLPRGMVLCLNRKKGGNAMYEPSRQLSEARDILPGAIVVGYMPPCSVGFK